MYHFETAVLLTTVTILIWYYLRRKWSVLKIWGIPHDPPSIFLVGHQRRVFGQTDASGYINDCKRKYGKVWGYYLATEPRIVVHDTDMLKKILIKDSQNAFPSRGDPATMTVPDLFISGVLFSSGKPWQRMRSTLSPAFSSARLRDMSPIIGKCIDTAMQNVADEATKGKEVEVLEVFGKFSLDVICATAFGTHGVGESSVSRVAALLDSDRQKPAHIALIRTLPKLRNFVLTVLESRRRKYLQYLTAFCRRVAKERDQSTTSNPRDLLQLMLESRAERDVIDDDTTKALTEHEVAANSITMLLAGRTTISHSLNYLAYNLAMNEKVQTRLRQEIDLHFEENKSLDWDVVGRMKYLEMCIAESMRLYPALFITNRTSTRDIEVGGIRVVKGASINIPIHALSRDPELWEQPLEFNPERFRDMTKVDSMVYQPFGNGPRVCIGKRFAMMEMKLFVARLLQKYVLLPSESTPPHPLELTYGGVVSPTHPVMLRIHRRSE